MPENNVKAAMHYVIAYAQEKRLNLGLTKLLKILFLSDVTAYQVHWGTSVTGARYVKGPYGPVPDNYKESEADLISHGLITAAKPKSGFDGITFTSLTDPDVSRLTADDLVTLRNAADVVCKMTAKEISRLTHNDVWNSVGWGEEIPFWAYIPCRTVESTEADIDAAKSRARELGYDAA